MSVYTELNSAEISQLLARFNLGEYHSHQGISAGVENTNYFVNTSEHALVLTLFEKHDSAELPFFFRLGEHLFNANCKVPQPFRDRTGDFLQMVKGKPAVFHERLRGQHIEANPVTMAAIAEALAAIHLATASFDERQQHSHGRHWIAANAPAVMATLTVPDQALLKQALAVIKAIPELPSGVIHADLFHDNTLFDGAQITGIIDWYFAGYDFYALDIAITLNDWCLDDAGHYDAALGQAFVANYQRRRALNALEQQYLPHLQVQSATRFWLSRTLAKVIHQQSTEQITVKDPEPMRRLLQQLLAKL